MLILEMYDGDELSHCCCIYRLIAIIMRPADVLIMVLVANTIQHQAWMQLMMHDAS